MNIVKTIDKIEEILPIYFNNEPITRPFVGVYENDLEDHNEFMEGGLREITIELHKRDANLRKEAIEKYGYACCVCGFNFKECYGDVGANFIEVHHLEPLSMKKKDQINTVNDVCVVCANCHRVLHKNGATPMKIDELRQIVKSMKEKKKDLLDKIAA